MQAQHLQETSDTEPRFSQDVYRCLLRAASELAKARDIEEITTIVKHAARFASGADGITFVLRDGDLCFYADEEAIGPLWKGQRFPMEACISGWVMLNDQTTWIEDIYQDSRIPFDAYKPTFVKSLAMVPIRSSEPVGAIGAYWAERHAPTREEIAALQVLADISATACSNSMLYQNLQHTVDNLEALLFAAAHSLREPLVTIGQYMDREQASNSGLNQAAARPILTASMRMSALLNDLSEIARCRQAPLTRQSLSANELLETLSKEYEDAIQSSNAVIHIEENLPCLYVDPYWALLALGNLLTNALTFYPDNGSAEVSIAAIQDSTGPGLVFRDRGTGVPERMGKRIFDPFQRGVGRKIPGTGAGLTLVRQIAERHAGRVWYKNRAQGGAEFFITFGRERRL